MFDINVKGLVFTVQEALPLMPDGGSIILNASIWPVKGGQDGASTAPQKQRCVRSRTWTADLKDRRIRVNAISPGVIDTPGLNELLGPRKKSIETLSDEIPIGRIETPDEIAKAVVFLASDGSSYVTGAEFFVDGGVAQV